MTDLFLKNPHVYDDMNVLFDRLDRRIDQIDGGTTAAIATIKLVSDGRSSDAVQLQDTKTLQEDKSGPVVASSTPLAQPAVSASSAPVLDEKTPVAMNNAPRAQWSIHMANVGDTFAMLFRADGTYEILTEMHNVFNPAEAKRVEANGWVADREKGQARPLNTEGVYMEPTRTLGDAGMKQGSSAILAKPYQQTALAGPGDVLVMCTDGFLNREMVVTLQTRRQTFQELISKFRPGNAVNMQMPAEPYWLAEMASAAVSEALLQSTGDNTTIAAVHFGETMPGQNEYPILDGAAPAVLRHRGVKLSAHYRLEDSNANNEAYIVHALRNGMKYQDLVRSTIDKKVDAYKEILENDTELKAQFIADEEEFLAQVVRDNQIDMTKEPRTGLRVHVFDGTTQFKEQTPVSKGGWTRVWLERARGINYVR